MEKLVDDGLVKAIGVANCGVKQVEEILGSCRIKPVANQVGELGIAWYLSTSPAHVRA